MKDVTILTDGPLFGRGRFVIDRALRRVGPPSMFEWATHPAEVQTPVVVALAEYDSNLLRQLDIQVPLLKARGYRFDLDRVVVPSFSPMLVGKGKMNLLPVLIWDIQKAVDEVGQLAPQFPLDDLTLFPHPDQFRQWCREAEESEWLAHDIETPMSKKVDDEEDDLDPSFQILRFSLATDRLKAITAPFQEPFIGLWREVARKRIKAVGWNSYSFDDPREDANGIDCGGERVDAQWCWHFMSPMLPRGLGHVSTYFDRVPEWKSVGSNQEADDAELYSAMDARQTMVNFLGVKRAMEARQI